MRDERDMVVEGGDERAGALGLGAPMPAAGVDHLALQVRERHRVVVDHAQRADAGRREISDHRAAEPAGADHQHARRLQRLLAVAAHAAQHDVARVALDLV